MDKDLPSKILDSNSIWAESQAVRKCPNHTVETALCEQALCHHKKVKVKVWVEILHI